MGLKYCSQKYLQELFPERASMEFSLATTAQGSRAQQMESSTIIIMASKVPFEVDNL